MNSYRLCANSEYSKLSVTQSKTTGSVLVASDVSPEITKYILNNSIPEEWQDEIIKLTNQIDDIIQQRRDLVNQYRTEFNQFAPTLIEQAKQDQPELFI